MFEQVDAEEERRRISAWREPDIVDDLADAAKTHPSAAGSINQAIRHIRWVEKEARYWKSLYRCVEEVGESRREDSLKATIDALWLRQRLADLTNEASFLLARLSEFENSSDNRTEDGEREWFGHVAPSISRLRTLISDDERIAETSKAQAKTGKAP